MKRRINTESNKGGVETDFANGILNAEQLVNFDVTINEDNSVALLLK